MTRQRGPSEKAPSKRRPRPWPLALPRSMTNGRSSSSPSAVTIGTAPRAGPTSVSSAGSRSCSAISSAASCAISRSAGGIGRDQAAVDVEVARPAAGQLEVPGQERLGGCSSRRARPSWPHRRCRENTDHGFRPPPEAQEAVLLFASPQSPSHQEQAQAQGCAAPSAQALRQADEAEEADRPADHVGHPARRDADRLAVDEPAGRRRARSAAARPRSTRRPIAVYGGAFGVRQAERLLWRAGFGPRPGRGRRAVRPRASRPRSPGSPVPTGAAP